VCRRLDGIPLAIELAAARVRSLSVKDIAAGLDDRFRLLADGSRTALARQRTLEAPVQWSYELRDAGERAVLRRLSVFQSAFDLAAAEQVAGGGWPWPTMGHVFAKLGVSTRAELAALAARRTTGPQARPMQNSFPSGSAS
jgi:predicted ATPase